MLFKVACALLIAWLLGVLGLYRIGNLVHAFFLAAVMLLMLAALKALDAVAHRGTDERSGK